MDEFKRIICRPDQLIHLVGSKMLTVSSMRWIRDCLLTKGQRIQSNVRKLCAIRGHPVTFVEMSFELFKFALFQANLQIHNMIQRSGRDV